VVIVRFGSNADGADELFIARKPSFACVPVTDGRAKTDPPKLLSNTPLMLIKSEKISGLCGPFPANPNEMAY
jgi:hypothetical protein